MKKIIFLFLFFNSISFLVSKAEATFTPTISIQNKEYKLVGQSLLEYSFFKIDVYWISYYKSSKHNSSLLKIIYARDIEKDVSNQGWDEGLKKNLKEKFSSYKKVDFFYNIKINFFYFPLCFIIWVNILQFFYCFFSNIRT